MSSLSRSFWPKRTSWRKTGSSQKCAEMKSHTHIHILICITRISCISLTLFLCNNYVSIVDCPQNIYIIWFRILCCGPSMVIGHVCVWVCESCTFSLFLMFASVRKFRFFFDSPTNRHRLIGQEIRIFVSFRSIKRNKFAYKLGKKSKKPKKPKWKTNDSRFEYDQTHTDRDTRW